MRAGTLVSVIESRFGSEKIIFRISVKNEVEVPTDFYHVPSFIHCFLTDQIFY